MSITEKFVNTTLKLKQPALLWVLAVFSNKDKPLTNIGDTALHLAVRSGQPQAVKILLKIGASPYVVNHEDETALNLARSLHNEHARNKQAIDNLDCWVASYDLLEKHAKSSQQVLRKLKAADTIITKYKEI